MRAAGPTGAKLADVDPEPPPGGTGRAAGDIVVEAPASVDVDREHGLALTWADGVESSFGLEELRVNCPCAGCRRDRQEGRTVWPRPTSPLPLRMLDARLVGAWGINLSWNDGHSTGIYSWTTLRVWAGPDAPATR